MLPSFSDASLDLITGLSVEQCVSRSVLANLSWWVMTENCMSGQDCCTLRCEADTKRAAACSREEKIKIDPCQDAQLTEEGKVDQDNN